MLSTANAMGPSEGVVDEPAATMSTPPGIDAGHPSRPPVNDDDLRRYAICMHVQTEQSLGHRAVGDGVDRVHI